MAFDFPNAPTVGQIFGSYKWDGEKWGPTTASAGGGAGTVSVVNTSAPISGGPITTTGTIGLNPASITNAFLATMPAATFKGNNDGATAAPLDLTVTQVKALLNYTTADITGNLSAAQMPAYTGDVTSPAGGTVNTIAPGAVQTAMIANLAVTAAVIGNAAVTTIKVANNTVSNIKMTTMADQTIKGNISGASTNPQDLTGTQVTTILDTFTSTLKGLVPPSGGGTTKFLRADGTWGTVGAGVSISDVPPSSPVPGQIWWESDSGAAFIWFQDANSSQWVALDSSAGLVPVASLISPKMDGTAAIGVDTGWARGDHVHPSDTSLLPLAGGTLTGGLTGTSISLSGVLVVGGNTAPGAISLNGPAAQIRAINLTTAGVMRWALFINNTAESGSNNGSGFGINRYSDAGVLLDMPFSIARPSGVSTFIVGGINAATVDAAGGATASTLTVMTREKGDARYLQLTGGSLSAPLTVTNQLNIVAAVGTSKQVTSYVGANPRWNIVLGDGAAETGGNAGNNFLLQNYGDNGAYIGVPLSINRASGAVTVTTPLTVNSAFTANSTVAVAGAITTSATIWANTSISTAGYMSCTGAMTASSHNFSGDSNYWLGTSGTENLMNFASGWFFGFARSGGLMRWVTQGNTLQAMTLDGNGQFFVASANATKPGGGGWNASSDARIKTVEADYAAGLEQVLALQPVVYHYNGNDADPTAMLNEPEVKAVQRSFVGLVAQAVELVMPEMVYQEEGWIDGKKVTDFRKLDNSPLIYAIVNAIKTIAERLDALEALNGV